MNLCLHLGLISPNASDRNGNSLVIVIRTIPFGPICKLTTRDLFETNVLTCDLTHRLYSNVPLATRRAPNSRLSIGIITTTRHSYFHHYDSFEALNTGYNFEESAGLLDWNHLILNLTLSLCAFQFSTAAIRFRIWKFVSPSLSFCLWTNFEMCNRRISGSLCELICVQLNVLFLACSDRMEQQWWLCWWFHRSETVAAMQNW